VPASVLAPPIDDSIDGERICMRRRFLYTLSLAFSVVAGSRPTTAQADVVISEILYEAQGADRNLQAKRPYDRQWVELFNAGDETVDLAGWQVGNVRDGVWTSPFPSGTRLDPRAALVVTGDPATFDADWGRALPRVKVQSFPDLPSEPTAPNKVVAIRDADGAVRDSVDYGAAGWPKVRGGDGHSVYALPAGLTARGNDLGENWRPASQGVYGARFTRPYGPSENHASPGIVVAEPQAPFAPSADAAWSMVVLPDTQNYVRDAGDMSILLDQMEWIKKSKDAFKIQLVLQEGDVVNQNGGKTHPGEQSAVQQWANARQAFSQLDGVLPYVMATGNHDYGTTNSQTRQTKFNDCFKATDNPLVDPAHGGILQGVMTLGSLENAYYELTAPDGRKLLVISLEFWPRQQAVEWANSIVKQPRFSNHTAILLTHAYMNSNETRCGFGKDKFGMGPDGNDGQELWNKLVRKHANFTMTLSGHFGGDQVAYLRSVGDRGQVVHQMLLNSQFEANGGNGWLRVLEFLADGQTVRVRTFSPYLGVYRTDAANQFEFAITPVGKSPATRQASESEARATPQGRRPAKVRPASLRSGERPQPVAR
jgi:hypothetical protein